MGTDPLAIATEALRHFEADGWAASASVIEAAIAIRRGDVVHAANGSQVMLACAVAGYVSVAEGDAAHMVWLHETAARQGADSLAGFFELACLQLSGLRIL